MSQVNLPSFSGVLHRSVAVKLSFAALHWATKLLMHRRFGYFFIFCWPGARETEEVSEEVARGVDCN